MMTNVLPFLLSGMWFLVGAAILRPERLSRDSTMDTIPWFYGAGIALSCYGFFIINALGVSLNTQRVVAWLLLGTLLGGARWLKSRSSIDSPNKFSVGSWSIPSLLGVSVFLLAGLTAWLQASALPLYHFDSIAHFGMDSKILFTEGSFRVPHFFEKGIVHTGPNFPMLIPYFQATLYWLLRSVNDLVVKQLYVVLWIAWFLLLNQRIRTVIPSPARWLLLALVASLPVLFLDDDSQWVAGSADPLLAFFWTGVVVSAVNFLEGRGQIWLQIMIWFSLGSIFSKPNGLPLCAMAWALLAWFERKKAVFVSGGILAALVLPWLWVQHQLPRDFTLPPITFASIPWNQLGVRSFHLLVGIAKELMNIRHWGIFWLVLLVGIACQPGRTTSARYMRWLLLCSGLIYGGYFLVDSRPIEWLLTASLSRWLIHLSPLALLSAAEFWQAGESAS